MRLVAAGECLCGDLDAARPFPAGRSPPSFRKRSFLVRSKRRYGNCSIGLAILILAAGIVSAWLARRVIATPLIVVVDELKHVARFDLEKVRRHASRLIEIENLSNAIADMAGGLAAFRKYIPADLVKTLVSEGVEPSPGGAIRNLTVLVRGYCRLYRAVRTARRSDHPAALQAISTPCRARSAAMAARSTNSSAMR